MGKNNSNSTLRIISGKFRGRSLLSPQSTQTHPMGAREKLALFNMVNVEQAKVLDAYAGSGALGIEAYSRGAAEVIFVEKSPQTCQIIRQNLTTLDIKATIFAEKMSKFLIKPKFVNYFDIILADPPYDQIDLATLANLSQVLRSDGILALSSPAETAPPTLPQLRLSSTHTYARARITVYRKDSTLQ